MVKGANEKKIYDLINVGKEQPALDELKQAMTNSGFDVNWKNEDDFDMSILAIACLKGAKDIVKEILSESKTIDVNQMSEEMSSPLHYACLTKDGRNECARLLLLDYRVDVNTLDDVNQSPLWEAAHNGNVELVKLFIALRGEELDVSTLSLSERPWMIKKDDDGISGACAAGTIDQFSKNDIKLISDQIDISNIIASFSKHALPVVVALRNELKISSKN